MGVIVCNKRFNIITKQKALVLKKVRFFGLEKRYTIIKEKEHCSLKERN